jgi:hypothetical protein
MTIELLIEGLKKEFRARHGESDTWGEETHDSYWATYGAIVSAWRQAEELQNNQETKLKGRKMTELKESICFTPDNLIDNLDKLGPWSTYGLASEALKHYFPEVYDNEDNPPSIHQEGHLVEEIGCKSWEDVIRKYHQEVGYTGNFDPGIVNKF